MNTPSTITPFHWFLLVLLVVTNGCRDYLDHERIEAVCVAKEKP